MKIAVSGKGGTGKTTIAACLASYMAARGAQVLAVDADADTSLGLALGLSPEELDSIPPLVDLEDVLAKAMGSGAYYPLNPDLDWIPGRYSVSVGNIRFLRMGDVKKGGSDCYCRENTFLQALVSSLVLSPGQVVILDMGAGIEHLARGTAQAVDLLLVVAEPGLSSLRTASNCEALARDLGIRNIRYIGNKAGNSLETEFIRDHLPGDRILGVIPRDGKLAAAAMGLPAGGLKEEEIPAEMKAIFDSIMKIQQQQRNGGI